METNTNNEIELQVETLPPMAPARRIDRNQRRHELGDNRHHSKTDPRFYSNSMPLDEKLQLYLRSLKAAIEYHRETKEAWLR